MTELIVVEASINLSEAKLEMEILKAGSSASVSDIAIKEAEIVHLTNIHKRAVLRHEDFMIGEGTRITTTTTVQSITTNRRNEYWCDIEGCVASKGGGSKMPVSSSALKRHKDSRACRGNYVPCSFCEELLNSHSLPKHERECPVKLERERTTVIDPALIPKVEVVKHWCPVEGCCHSDLPDNYPLACLRNLQTHMKSINCLANFPACEFCGQHFKQTSMKCHKAKCPDKPPPVYEIVCKYCSYCVSTKKSMKQAKLDYEFHLEYCCDKYITDDPVISDRIANRLREKKNEERDRDVMLEDDRLRLLMLGNITSAERGILSARRDELMCQCMYCEYTCVTYANRDCHAENCSSNPKVIERDKKAKAEMEEYERKEKQKVEARKEKRRAR